MPTWLKFVHLMRYNAYIYIIVNCRDLLRVVLDGVGVLLCGLAIKDGNMNELFLRNRAYGLKSLKCRNTTPCIALVRHQIGVSQSSKHI